MRIFLFENNMYLVIEINMKIDQENVNQTKNLYLTQITNANPDSPLNDIQEDEEDGIVIECSKDKFNPILNNDSAAIKSNNFHIYFP